ncbi:MAG: ankyrin repeat domain-containing protein [Bacteroidia bacterium]|nr:ankyrin repeat domain-containing protein [Bacteroidia bacterium]
MEKFFSENSINAVDSDGRNLMFHAIRHKKLGLVSNLIERGINFDSPDNLGWYPLHYAVQQSTPDIVKALISANADINATDGHGNNVLWRAVFESKGSGEIIKLLLLNGANPNIKNNYGISALDLAKSISNYDILQFFSP